MTLKQFITIKSKISRALINSVILTGVATLFHIYFLHPKYHFILMTRFNNIRNAPLENGAFKFA